jgi:endonuclease/exonuclease/phosphatase family metal-dependent hydrolase
MRKWTGLLALAMVAGCTSDTPLGPIATAAGRLRSLQDAGANRIVVYNQNVYPGADVDAVIAALASGDPNDDLPALLTAVGQLQFNEVEARAGGVADQIEKYRPDVVGLNEITEIDVDLSPFGGPAVQQDFLASLQQALQDRGLDYEVASTVQDIVATPVPFVSYVDYDVVLVNPDRVTVNDDFGLTFGVNVGIVAPGVELRRGRTGIDAEIGGLTVTILTAHPEPGETAPFTTVRAAQATELVQSLGTTSPVIMMGDYNDVPGSPLYQIITGAGFTDLWAALHPGARGFTAAGAYDPTDLERVKRIDYIWVRGFESQARDAMGTIKLVNDQPSDRVQAPEGLIYVSDHAGVVATILLPPGLTD